MQFLCLSWMTLHMLVLNSWRMSAQTCFIICDTLVCSKLTCRFSMYSSSLTFEWAIWCNVFYSAVNAVRTIYSSPTLLMAQFHFTRVNNCINTVIYMVVCFVAHLRLLTSCVCVLWNDVYVLSRLLNSAYSLGLILCSVKQPAVARSNCSVYYVAERQEVGGMLSLIIHHGWMQHLNSEASIVWTVWNIWLF